MPGALPPVTDCGCSSSDSDDSSESSCCQMEGVGDPNEQGVTPPDTTIWYRYTQLADLVAGPPLQEWRWNPNLLVWQ